MTVSDFFNYMKPGMKGHLVGIGGVSMSALAETLKAAGIEIRGSDERESAAVDRLRDKGIPVYLGHSAENVKGADFVVRTAAAKDSNPEVMAARELGVPVFERTQAWGAIMMKYKNAVCVAGTHGKTTTTSMVTHILMAAGRDPTVMIGGYLPLIGSGCRTGEGEDIVLEACEYCNSFLSFSPTVAVILNVDADHLDFFTGIDEIKSSFRRFAELVPDAGCVVANLDDENTMAALEGTAKRVVTFGLSGKADIRAVNVDLGRTASCDMLHRGAFLTHAELRIGGRHNIYNALAAAAAALELGVGPEHIRAGLESFGGAGRRLEYKGRCNGADVYDDYAHHPRELRALLQTAAGMGYARIICVFQPHTYSRTKALLEDFISELRLPDKVYLAEIYAAREKNTVGISSKELADRIEGAVYCPDFDGLAAMLEKEARPGDMIITVGAGDIYKVGEKIIQTGAC